MSSWCVPVFSPDDAKSAFCTGSLQNIGRLFREYTGFTDFTVKIKNKSLQCNSLILAASSKYFECLFRNEMAEKKSREVTLEDFCEETFQKVLDILQTGDINIDFDNVWDIWFAADRLQIDNLAKICEEFLLSSMTKDTYPDMYENAKSLCSEKVLDRCFAFMREDFKAFKKTRIFTRLHFVDLLELIKSHDLDVSSDEIVVEAIFTWVDAQKEKENSHLSELLAASRLCYVENDCLLNTLDRTLVYGDVLAAKVVETALRYKLLVNERNLPWQDCTTHRDSSPMKHGMIFVSDSFLQFYNISDQNTTQIQQLMAMNLKGKKHLLFASDSSVFVFGFEASAVRLFKYHPCTKTFDKVAIDAPGSYGQITYYPDAAAVSNCSVYWIDQQADVLHLFGNLQRTDQCSTKELFSVDCPLNIGSTWKEPYLCSYQDKLIIFNASSETEIPTTLAAVYCPKKNEPFVLESIEGPAENLITFSDGQNNTTYLLQANGALWKMANKKKDRSVDFVFQTKLWENFLWSLRGAVVYRGTLVILGVNGSYAEPKGGRKFPDSVPGLFAKVEIVELPAGTQSLCVPVIWPQKYIV